MITLSIIIPTCNRNESLAKCLERLKHGKQNFEDSQYEVIVSDDGKNNTAKELIETSFSWVKWVEGPKRGPAANRNNGARFAAGEWLVFTDDDCLPDSNWLHAYSNAIAVNPGCKAFEGAILPDHWELLKMDLAECPVNTKGGCFWSANIMIEKKMFESIGGFDEQFIIAAQEDQDLQMRISKHSTIVFIKNSVVIHPVRFNTIKSRINKIGPTAINWHKYYRKDHNFITTVLKGLSSQSGAMISAITKRKAKSTVYHLLYTLSVIPVLLYAEFKNEVHK